MSTLTLQLEDDSGIHNLQLYCHGFVFMFHLESSKTQRQNKGEQTSCYDVWSSTDKTRCPWQPTCWDMDPSTGVPLCHRGMWWRYENYCL